MNARQPWIASWLRHPGFNPPDIMSDNPLPYHDTKPQGAADFYYATNATFRFIRKRLGTAGLQRYWSDIGRDYYRPVTESWRAGGLPAVAAYWKAFFKAEPGGDDVEVVASEKSVVLNVRRCPAITHLRAGKREILSDFCEHCYYVSDAMAEGAGLAARVEGGNGACRQEFLPRAQAAAQPPITPCI